jgi:thiol-disulfide isomerase/thioredoxin
MNLVSRAAAAGLALLLANAAMAQQKPAPDVPRPVAASPRQPEEMRLKIGDAAPPLKVQAWVKGDPVESFEKGKVYVVEFWATWCNPCRVTIPHLTELQRRYKDSGVKIIGVSIWEDAGGHEIGTIRHDAPEAEQNAAYLARVQDFVKGQGDGMAYTLAFGGVYGSISMTWMMGSGQVGIPASFIIDKSGKVAWMGYPLDLDQPLAEIVAGNYDMAHAAENAAKQAAIAKKSRELSLKFEDAMLNNNMDAARKYLDEYAALDVKNNWELKYGVLVQEFHDQAGADDYLKALANGEGKDNPDILAALAQKKVTGEGTIKRDVDEGLKLATRADNLSDHKNPEIVGTLANAYFENGEVGKAIELQTRAVSLLDSGTPAEVRTAMEKALARYKAAKK